MAERLVFCSVLLAACGVEERAPVPPDVILGTGEFDGLPTGVDQWKRLCATGHTDAITRKFCAGDEPPRFTSLEQLQLFLGLDVRDRNSTRTVLTGLSTGVGLRRVTPLTPRAITFQVHSNILPFIALSFARGEPLVELVANDLGPDPTAKDDDVLRFFVLRFHPPCESTDRCNNADLLTPAIESNWSGYTLYDEETIKNTPLDCRACHQPGGPDTPKLLRMQEFRDPWNHWFASNSTIVPNNRDADFHAAHGDEPYANLPPSLIGSPAELEDFLAVNGYDFQPNVYDSSAINEELEQAGASSTWNVIYERAVTGHAIPPPYFAGDQTDPAKVAPMISAYQRVMAGTLARELLPDIRDTLLDSALPAMSIRPKQGLDGRGILVHICSRCHNSRLDQTQSRANFNVEALDTLPRAIKDRAIERLRLADDHPRKMPPIRFHTLSDEERALAISELSR
jgi:hypothetical protein